MSAKELHDRAKNDLLDAIAFQTLGWPGFPGRWAARRVAEVWCAAFERGEEVP